MSLRRSSGRARAPLVLGLLCAVLGGAIYLELQPPPIEAVAAPRLPGHAPAKPAAASTATFSMPPVATYGEVVRRPLFSESRRPAPKAATAAKSNPTGLALNGTIINPKERCAIIQHGQPARQEHFCVGQDVDGWTVEAVETDSAILTNRSGRRIELKPDVKAKDGGPQVRPGVPLRVGSPQTPAIPSTLSVQPAPVQQVQQDGQQAQPVDNNLALRLFGRLPGRPPAGRIGAPGA